MVDFSPPGVGQSQGSAGGTDVVTALQGIVQQLSSWVQAFQGRMVFGTVRLSAAATTVVANTAVKGNSIVILSPTNAAAATLVSGTNSPYVSALSAGTSFTLATAAGGSAAGTETFNYVLISPV